MLHHSIIHLVAPEMHVNMGLALLGAVATATRPHIVFFLAGRSGPMSPRIPLQSCIPRWSPSVEFAFCLSLFPPPLPPPPPPPTPCARHPTFGVAENRALGAADDYGFADVAYHTQMCKPRSRTRTRPC